MRHALFQYFDEVVYRRFPLPMRRFLLELSPFPSFDAEQARMVSGESNAGELLRTLQEDTTMMLFDDLERCHFWEVFSIFSSGSLHGNIRWSSKKPSISGVACIMSCMRIIPVHWNAMPKAATRKRSLTFWRKTPRIIPAPVTTLKCRTIITFCRNRRFVLLHP